MVSGQEMKILDQDVSLPLYITLQCTLQLLYKEYTARCNSIRQLNVAVGFDKLKMALLEDLNFIDNNGKIAKDAYQKVVDVPGKKESTLMQLAWSVTGFEMLNKQANEFINSLPLCSHRC